MIPLDGEALADVANPGVIPLVILVVMFVAVFFLWRSMRKMLMTMDPDLPRKADLEAEEASRPDDSVRRPGDATRKPVSPAASPISPDVG